MSKIVRLILLIFFTALFSNMQPQTEISKISCEKGSKKKWIKTQDKEINCENIEKNLLTRVNSFKTTVNNELISRNKFDAFYEYNIKKIEESHSTSSYQLSRKTLSSAWFLICLAVLFPMIYFNLIGLLAGAAISSVKSHHDEEEIKFKIRRILKKD